MSLRLWRVVWGRLRTDWAFLFACWLLVATAVTLVTAGALYADTVELGGVRRALAEADPADRGVSVRTAARSGAAAEFDRAVRDVLARAFDGTGSEIVLTQRSTSLKPATGGQPGLDPAQPVQRQLIVVGSYQGIEAHADLVSGAWPVAGQLPMQAAVSEPAAKALGASIGSRLQLADAATPGADPTAVVADLVVVGVWKPISRDDGYWLGDTMDLDGVAEASTISRGPVMLAPADFAAQVGSSTDMRWRALPLVDQLQLGQVDRLRAWIGALPAAVAAALPEDHNVTVNANLAEVLGTIDRSVAVSRSGVVLVILQFALLAGYAVLLAGALLVERRRPEVALLRARGARPNQVAGLALAESASLAIPAAIVAPPVALAVIGFIGGLGAVGDAGIISAPALTPSEIGLTAAAGLACVLALSLPALVADVDLAHVRAALGRPLGRTLAQRIGLDLVLAVVTAVGLFQLQSYGSPLARDAGGELTIDPILVAAPALSLAAGALLVIRIVPRIGEIADWLFRRRRGLLMSLASRQIARRPLRYTRTALLIVLAAALATFAAAYSSTWALSQADQAAFQVGADIRVPIANPATADRGGEELAAVAGVSAAAPALRDHADVGRIVPNTNILAIDSKVLSQRIELPNEAEATGRQGLAALAATAADFNAINLPLDSRRIGVLLDIDLEPADPNFPIPDLQAGPNQGIEVTVELINADGAIVRLPALAQTFRQSGYRVEFELPEAGKAQRAPSLLSLEIQGRPPVFMIGDIDLVGIESNAFAAGADVPWTPLVDPRSMADWGFPETGGTNIHFDRNQPMLARGEFFDAPLQIYKWAPAAPTLTELGVLAGDSFLAASGTIVGDTISLTYHTKVFPARIVGSVPVFPSLDAIAPFLITDLRSLRVAATGRGLADLHPTEWWLWIEPGTEEAVAEALAQPSLGFDGMFSQAALRRSLERDPIALGLVGALALGSLAAAVCAAVGLIVGAIVSTRERLAENALLRALGMSRRSVTTGVLIDNGYLLVFGLLAGLGLGSLIGLLVLPHTALNRSGVRVIPTPVIVIPLEIVVGLTVIGLVLLVTTALAAGRIANRAPIADVLRAGEAA